MRVSSSSSPRMASWRWRGLMRFTLRSLEALPASSSTSAVRYSKIAARYTALVAPVTPLAPLAPFAPLPVIATRRVSVSLPWPPRALLPPLLDEAVHAAHGELQPGLLRARDLLLGGARHALG